MKLSPLLTVTLSTHPLGCQVLATLHSAFTLTVGYAIGIWLKSGDGNMTVVWTAKRDDPPISSNSTLELTVDGLLLKQGSDVQGQVYVDTEPAGFASMLNSGNFVIYAQESSSPVAVPVWQSFHHPTDTILGGQNLTIRNQLVSSMSTSDRSTGHYFLAFQRDNDLVAYPINSSAQSLDAYWASISMNLYGVEQLNLDTEGNLCFDHVLPCLVNNSNHQNQPQNTSSIYRATLDVDGNLRLYEHLFEDKEGIDITILWKARSDECQIKGFCGINSYCSNTNGNARCQCYPGFVPCNNETTGRNAMFLECKLNYSKDDCERSGDRNFLLYNIVSLEEMWWDGYPYWAKQMSMGACEKSCKTDCDCGAALYTNGQCNKYSLPLRYGSKASNELDTGMALFKVPSGYVFRGNTTTSSPKKPNAIDNNRKGLILILASTLGSISFLCVVFVVSIFFTYRSQVHRLAKLSASSKLGFTEECSLRSFSFDELVKATNGFTEEVGRGSFGAVYRGTIGENNRIRIAVKRMERIVDEGEREFRAEITAIARTHHRNLVKLVGFCIEGSRKLLVYEYVSNGSLANLLFKTKKHLPLKERLKIALDVARGVQYLHEECEVCIAHCNLKPQNILMDELLTAKLSDFGLARLSKPEFSRNRADKEVTTGYLAPEWQKEALVSIKADVFSYGIVLLEIVCRRRNIEVNVPSPEEVLLSTWAYHCFATEQLHDLVVVAYQEEDMDWKTLERMLKVGLLCVQDYPSLRPSMRDVILMLEGWKHIPIPPSPSPSR
ncbi:hypothetical protein PIB30_019434 [Stylosanthes scabra]|uniref:Receptor-like serine/threonine-protein kinase n=1 Tax=Stylosanthes scabra TaxID=79078 RepID=A0ABU6R8H8_9FABA|nr:hypothetical protein [Stylosanthes scabra]